MADIFFRKKITSRKTLAERLRYLRRKKKLTLSQAEEATRVRYKYLEALERGDYGVLPADVYTIGFLSKYAEFLKTAKEPLIESFRKEKGSSSKSQLLPSLRLKTPQRFIITPKLLGISGIVLVILFLFGYVFYSVRHFTAPPNLEISQPVTETVIRQDNVEVKGKTDIGSSLQINGQTVFLDEFGNFQVNVHLQPGMNNIEISSTNRVKKQSVKVVKVLAEY